MTLQRLDSDLCRSTLVDVPTVSVIIPARNDAAGLGEAIASVGAQQNVLVQEIVIAVGPSTDDTEAEARRLAAENPSITVLESPTGRTPNALNLAIAASSGAVVVRVDARSVLPTDYIQNALTTMAETGAANVGAIQLPVGVTSTERSIAAAMRSSLGSGGASYRHATEVVRADTGYLGVFLRSVLDEVGGYDESFVRNQDSELNLRIQNAGYEVWLNPKMVVRYTPRSTLRALGRQYFQYGLWRYRTVRKHGSIRFRQVVAPIVVLWVVACLGFALFVSVRFLLFPAAYVLVIAGATILETTGLSFPQRCKFAAALMIIHLAWGAGFLSSIAQGVGASRSAR